MSGQEPASDESYGRPVPVETVTTNLGPRQQALVGVASVVVLLLANYWIFRLLGAEYFRWYVANGDVFALVFALLSAAVDLDRYDNLVSASPGHFMAGWEEIVGSFFLWWSVSQGSSERTTSVRRELGNLANGLAEVVALVAVSLALIGWILVVAPAQYLVTLFCGAPARLAIASEKKLVVNRTRRETKYWTLPVDAPVPSGFAEIGFRTKPVTFTNVIAAAALYGVSFAI